jgi:hypothetical protein
MMNNNISGFILLLLLLTATCATANDRLIKFSCGKTSITLYSSNIPESPFFVISVWNGKSREYYTYLATSEFLDVRCEKNEKGKDFLLVNHFCGGSGCATSNYALIDLTGNKEVLKASQPFKGNSDKATYILGKAIAPFSCKRRSDGLSEPNDKNEYCLVSHVLEKKKR